MGFSPVTGGFASNYWNEVPIAYRPLLPSKYQFGSILLAHYLRQETKWKSSHLPLQYQSP